MLLYARILVQINFQISQNDRNWFQMTCIDSKVRDVIPIPGILADLEITLDENSGAKQHKLYYMCFR